MFLVQEGALALPDEDAVLRVTPMEPEEFEELVRSGVELVSALPHMTVLVMRHKMGLDVPEGSGTEVRLGPGEAAVLVGRGDRLGAPFRFRKVERLDADTPSGRLTVARVGERESPGVVVSVGGKDVAVVEYCAQHGTPAAHLYHESQEEPVVSMHVCEYLPSVVFTAGDPVLDAGGVWRFGRELD